MHVSSRSYYVLGARDAGGMRYMAGPVAFCSDVDSARQFTSAELASAWLVTARGFHPTLEWQVLRARAEIALEAIGTLEAKDQGASSGH